jgi:cystathionine beta-lyase/cystathionine gamma-synthase
VSTPIYQTAAFDLDDIDRPRRLWTGAELGSVHTQVGNPTVSVLEEAHRGVGRRLCCACRCLRHGRAHLSPAADAGADQ